MILKKLIGLFTIDLFHNYSDVEFYLGGVILKRDPISSSYLGVTFLMRRNDFVEGVNNRRRIFNFSAFIVLLNSIDFSKIIKCVDYCQKCIPILTYGLCCEQLWLDGLYKLHVAYPKIYWYTVKLSLRSSTTDLLITFSVKCINNAIECKMNRMIRLKIFNQYNV